MYQRGVFHVPFLYCTVLGASRCGGVACYVWALKICCLDSVLLERLHLPNTSNEAAGLLLKVSMVGALPPVGLQGGVCSLIRLSLCQSCVRSFSSESVWCVTILKCYRVLNHVTMLLGGR